MVLVSVSISAQGSKGTAVPTALTSQAMYYGHEGSYRCNHTVECASRRRDFSWDTLEIILTVTAGENLLGVFLANIQPCMSEATIWVVIGRDRSSYIHKDRFLVVCERVRFRALRDVDSERLAEVNSKKGIFGNDDALFARLPVLLFWFCFSSSYFCKFSLDSSLKLKDFTVVRTSCRLTMTRPYLFTTASRI